MKITWRKIEFNEFIRFRKWAFSRRRVGEMPAYYQPIGFGFSIVKPIRQGFWQHPKTKEVFAGFIDNGTNFHYFGSDGCQRSSSDWPEPALIPLSFHEGYLLLRDGPDGRMMKIRRMTAHLSSCQIDIISAGVGIDLSGGDEDEK